MYKNRKIDFDKIHNSSFEGWGFSFRRSQLYRFKKYINLLRKYKVKGRVLDIGCSTGFFSNRFLKPLFNEVIAIDVSEVAIRKAKEKYPGIKFIKGSLLNINFCEEMFDCITLLEVLYYLNDYEQNEYLKKIAKLLKEDGYFLISVNIGSKPYFNKEEIKNLLKKYFYILEEDGIYIKTYYKFIEEPLYLLLKLISSPLPIKIKESDSIIKKIVKYVVNFVFRNKYAYYSYGFFLQYLLKFILFIIPIEIIDFISKKISKDELSIYIAICKKK